MVSALIRNVEIMGNLILIFKEMGRATLRSLLPWPHSLLGTPLILIF
jgi:hypothetical protein